jgi:cystathionine beta-lyase/cystathionine gamma-synthase
MSRRRPGIATIAVGGAEPPPGGWPVGIATPVFGSVTYELDGDAYADIARTGGTDTWWYSRLRNPTVEAAAAKVAALEGAQRALLFSSGMAAIATTLLALLPPGGRVVAARDLYGDVFTLLGDELRRHGRSADFVAIDDHDGWRRELERGVDLLYVETLSNPMLRVADLPALAAIAHEFDALALADATFTPPSLLRPLDLGFDLVLHSATKFLNGHSDVVAGAVAGSSAILEAVAAEASILGGCLDPQAASMLDRGLKTLVIRTERQSASAHALADWLSQHTEIEQVAYPLLDTHPDHDLARALMPAGGGIVSFRVIGGDERALALLDAVRVIHQATSLGGVETLASAPHNTSHLGLSSAELAAAGILPGTIRLSVGLEDVDDLIADLQSALTQTQAARSSSIILD